MATVDIEKTDQAAAVDQQALVDHIVGKYRNPEWLVSARRRQWEAYRKAAMPDQVRHLWRYTDPEHFLLKTEQVVPQNGGNGSDAYRFWENEDLAGAALWHGGQVAHLQLDDDLKSRGVILSDLHTAAWDHGRLVEAHLGKATSDRTEKFEMLNTALWQAGFFLHIPRNVVVEQPIHLIIAGGDDTPFLAPRILIVLEEGAQATVVTEFVSGKDAKFDVNTAMESCVGRGANLRLVTVQRWGEQVTSYFNQRSLLGRDATLLGVWAGLGGGINKADIGTRVEGQGANVKLLGMSFGQRNQHFDQHTEHDHRAGNTYSDLDFKVVLKDEARSAYTGLIRIDPNATNCEAFQENRNLLLSDGTRADTIPELEIMTDEVRCSHGATIGPLDESELFYLAARGIPRDEAIRMVVSGFVEPTLKEVPEDLQERLRSYVIERVKEI